MQKYLKKPEHSNTKTTLMYKEGHKRSGPEKLLGYINIKAIFSSWWKFADYRTGITTTRCEREGGYVSVIKNIKFGS